MGWDGVPGIWEYSTLTLPVPVMPCKFTTQTPEPKVPHSSPVNEKVLV